MTEPRSIRFEIDTSNRLRRTILQGVITEPVLFAAFEQLLSDPDYDSTLNELVDMRAVERLEVTGKAVRQLVELFAEPASHSTNKLAIVAATAHIFGMARMYEILSSETSEQIEVFRDLKEAESWLGIDSTNQDKSLVTPTK